MNLAPLPPLLAALLTTTVAAAQEAAPPKPKKPPYSLPWQLRPVAPGNVVRADTSFQMYKPTGASSGGTVTATSLAVAFKVLDSFAPLVRLGFVSRSPSAMPQPAAAEKNGSAFLNPVVGGLYGTALSPDLKLGLFLGLALPFGSGAGAEPKPEVAAALGAGMGARRFMDNAMFATNYLTPFPGVGLAYVASGVTVQAEVTFLQLMRVKGKCQSPPQNATCDKDAAKTNLTSGLHVGYFVLPELSIGAELNYQRWLSKPKKPAVEAKDHLTDNLSVAVGPRIHVDVGSGVWLRPGIAYARFLDRPQGDPDKYESNHIIQVDVPCAF